MRSALITAFTAMVLLLSSLATAAVAQVSREVRVELAGYARGIRAATLTMDIDLVGNYDLVFRVEPTAAARVFGMQGMTLRGRGAQTANNLYPGVANYSGGGDNIRIAWSNGAATVTGASASQVNPAAAGAAVDPATAILLAMHRFTQGGSCAGSRDVFDGSTLLRATYRDRGAGTISSRGYSGSAQQCRITYQVVQGRQGRGTAPLTLWLAQPVAGGPFVPVRVELTFGSEVAVFEALSIR